MMTGREHEQLIRNVAKEALHILGDLRDDHDLTAMVGTQDKRNRLAREINACAVRMMASSGGWFAGTVNEKDLRNVATTRDLIDVLLRHANGELEDDTWSAL